MKLSSAIDRQFSFLLVGSLLAGSGLVASVTLASAADQEPARRHSLIHRQESGSTTIAPESSAQAAPAPAVTSPHPLHRKLTKRPGLATLTAPSNSSSQAVTPAPQGASTLPATKAGSDPQLSMAGTSLSNHAPIPSATATPLPRTPGGSTGTAVPLAGARLSTANPPASNALAAPGTGAVRSSGAGAAGGRGMQRLAGQMPGLTQLLAPVVSVSTPPPSSPASPPSSPSAPPPSSAPPPPAPGTGSATLSWVLNSESDLAGYKIYIGTAPGLYNYPGSPIAIGRVAGYTITGLPYGQTYYFAISAYNYSGGESALSSEVSKSIY